MKGPIQSPTSDSISIKGYLDPFRWYSVRDEAFYVGDLIVVEIRAGIWSTEDGRPPKESHVDPFSTNSYSIVAFQQERWYRADNPDVKGVISLVLGPDYPGDDVRYEGVPDLHVGDQGVGAFALYDKTRESGSTWLEGDILINGPWWTYKGTPFVQPAGELASTNFGGNFIYGRLLGFLRKTALGFEDSTDTRRTYSTDEVERELHDISAKR